ncbi:MAG: hypothetical protein MUE47_09845 [Acidobacteria bacterium]|jgi:hypothetical protein|nr:hypothetical protein [Acidobacteriota bacterium]
MRRPLARPLLALLAAALVLPALATPPLPETPAAVRGLVYARPFTLDTPFRYDWSAEHPEVSSGLMLVLEADPALLRPRETQEPILFVGSLPAQRVTRAFESGRVVVLIPGEVDLAADPIWFGTPGLPEQVDAAAARAERDRAARAAIAPAGRRAAEAALARGGAPARFASKTELLQALAALAREYGAAP